MLCKAQQERYAIGAFNIENMEMAQAVLEVAQQEKAPVILQTTPSTLCYAPPEVFVGIVKGLMKAVTVPVALHLDHGNSLELLDNVLSAGFSSVMFDGSALPLKENIEMTSRAVRIAEPYRVSVEAELGRVGGKEDSLDVKADNKTDPQEALWFTEKTCVDSLAVGIGTVHGFYRGVPALDKQLLGKIRSMLEVPLVLHGASGLPDADVRDCIALGVCKVNFATELRAAYTDGVKETLYRQPDLFDPKIIGDAGKTHVRELVRKKIRLCGCAGKAE